MKDTKIIKFPGGTSISVDEEGAFSVLDQLRRAFGWEGTEFTRKDVEDTLGRPLTEKEWRDVQANSNWNRSIAEQATEGGWYAIENLILDLDLTNDEDAGTV